MPSLTILRESQIIRTPRVMQAEGIFDIQPSQKSAERWEIDLNLPDAWNVGLIVGPSGCGKSTLARELFADNIADHWDWPQDKSLLDGFPSDMSIKDITALLSSVGFSTPPSWVRPFSVLSNGEQFRVSMARTLAEKKDLAVVDEFTSVVDRTVAQIGSAAIAKTVRRRNMQFIAVSCHYDIAEWLEPDWIYEPHLNRLSRDCLQRPKIKLEIKRVHHSAWRLFRKHHYLNHDLNPSAVCFCAFWNDTPVAFSASLHFPHPSSRFIKREHRVVCLPDYQGVGIGNALSAYVASLWRGLGFRYQSQTSNPAMIGYRCRSLDWRMIANPNCKSKKMPQAFNGGPWDGAGRQATRLRATFEYTGKALERQEALRVFGE